MRCENDPAAKVKEKNYNLDTWQRVLKEGPGFRNVTKAFYS